MAKKAGKSKGYKSAGINSTVEKKLRKAIRRRYIDGPDRLLNQLKAHRKGKNTMVTIENPNKAQTNQPYIKVPGKDIFPPDDPLWMQKKKAAGEAS